MERVPPIVRRDTSRGSSRLAGVFSASNLKKKKKEKGQKKRKEKKEKKQRARRSPRDDRKREVTRREKINRVREESVVPLIALIDDTRRETPRRLRARSLSAARTGSSGRVSFDRSLL